MGTVRAPLWLALVVMTRAHTSQGHELTTIDLSAHPVKGVVDSLPAGFMWGSATASYQVEGATEEGGRGPTIWDTFSHRPGKTAHGDTGDVADDQYHRYGEDTGLMIGMGLTHYRMSLAWSRIMPTGQLPLNQEGIDHYRTVLDELKVSGIEPLVTLYHWDLPQALEDQYGGWLNDSLVEIFAEYADACFEAFGPQVRKWLTFNEPWSFCHHGYQNGILAPGRCSDREVCEEGDGDTEPYMCAHNVINAHARAMEVFRTKHYPRHGGEIGITLNSDWSEPWSDSPEDQESAQRHTEFSLGWFADPVYFGKYPDSMVERVGSRLPAFTEEQAELLKSHRPDFFGQNYYASVYTRDRGAVPQEEESNGEGWDRDHGAVVTYIGQDGKLIGPTGDSFWLHSAPWGFRKILNWSWDRYQSPIIVTENGCDVQGESMMPLPEVLQDPFRVEYLSGHIAAMNDAVGKDKVNVTGYFAWSLLDNFEWADGYSKRFGLHYVDYANGLARHPKSSAAWLTKLIDHYNLEQSCKSGSEDAALCVDALGTSYGHIEVPQQAASVTGDSEEGGEGLTKSGRHGLFIWVGVLCGSVLVLMSAFTFKRLCWKRATDEYDEVLPDQREDYLSTTRGRPHNEDIGA